MNKAAMIKKLQTALSTKGRVIRKNTYQFYSAEQGRLIDSYVLIEKRPAKNKKGETIMKDYELLNTCSQIDVIKFLAELLKGGDG